VGKIAVEAVAVKLIKIRRQLSTGRRQRYKFKTLTGLLSDVRGPMVRKVRAGERLEI
jgi:hypothetical protein